MKLKVSLDGGVTFLDAPEGVRVYCEGVDVPGEEEAVEVHLNFTDEGVITDLWSSNTNVATASETFEELVDRLVEQDSGDEECSHNGSVLTDSDPPATWYCPDCGTHFISPDEDEEDEE